MQQLALEFESHHTTQPRLDNFIDHVNQGLVEYLSAIPKKILNASNQGKQFIANEWVYIWGATQSGKTHLLKALCYFGIEAGLKTVFLSPIDSCHAFEFHDAPTIYCIDDVHLLNDDQQLALFNLINETRINPLSAVITSGIKAPTHMHEIREDLRTRLAWGLVYQLHSLDLQQQQQAVLNYAREKNIALNQATLKWLSHCQFNDLNSLKDMLILLDTYSLEQKKKVNVTLIKKMLQELQGAC